MVSLGALNYDMSRTHSIMRIATTASPVSGAEVIREKYSFREKYSRSILIREKRSILEVFFLLRTASPGI